MLERWWKSKITFKNDWDGSQQGLSQLAAKHRCMLRNPGKKIQENTYRGRKTLSKLRKEKRCKSYHAVVARRISEFGCQKKTWKSRKEVIIFFS
jgi:hypothetical protein